MKNITGIGQFLLRLAIAVSFFMAVMDRLGLLGTHGSGTAWGDWKHFVDYTNTLVPFVNRPLANIIGFVATIAELVFGMLLVVGYRIKEAALGAGILTLCFGLCMAMFVSISAPVNYPVFVFTGSALILSTLDHHAWSIDNYIQKRTL
ncbi:DoxX family protein [Mucilaginibacter endophyticus]|uniref:DoxX family protein n=1 Tax=Mucilaginibacter endophyticus TaxID=2675003 RepID=UPI000E0E05E9|nr:DoxX family protein [Mucilaginibacter endophyticus]